MRFLFISLLLFTVAIPTLGSSLPSECNGMKGISGEETYKALIKKYYRDIDHGWLNPIFDLFDNNAVYSRGTRGFFPSKKEIVEFFLYGRKGLNITHQIQSINATGSVVEVEGTFVGTSNGTPVSSWFKDQWMFNKEGLVIYRKSVIGIPGI